MSDNRYRTVITDIDIPFWRVVAILIKWVIAAIPALIVVWLIVLAVWILIGALFGYAIHGPELWRPRW